MKSLRISLSQGRPREDRLKVSAPELSTGKSRIKRGRRGWVRQDRVWKATRKSFLAGRPVFQRSRWEDEANGQRCVVVVVVVIDIVVFVAAAAAVVVVVVVLVVDAKETDFRGLQNFINHPFHLNRLSSELKAPEIFFSRSNKTNYSNWNKENGFSRLLTSLQHIYQDSLEKVTWWIGFWEWTPNHSFDRFNPDHVKGDRYYAGYPCSPPLSHYTRALEKPEIEARRVVRRRKDVERKIAGSIPERASRFSLLQSRHNDCFYAICLFWWWLLCNLVIRKWQLILIVWLLCNTSEI